MIGYRVGVVIKWRFEYYRWFLCTSLNDRKMKIVLFLQSNYERT